MCTGGFARSWVWLDGSAEVHAGFNLVFAQFIMLASRFVGGYGGLNGPILIYMDDRELAGHYLSCSKGVEKSLERFTWIVM